MIVGFEHILDDREEAQVTFASDGEMGRVVGFTVLSNGADLHVTECSLTKKDRTVIHALSMRTPIALPFFKQVLDQHQTRVDLFQRWLVEDGDVITFGVRNNLAESQLFCAALVLVDAVMVTRLWWANIETGVLMFPVGVNERFVDAGMRSSDGRAVAVDPFTYEGFDRLERKAKEN